MPSTIPYDPSLVLASVVNEKAVAAVKAISDKQKEIDAAQDHMNALLSTKRSLEMTKSELLNMNIDVANLEEEVKKLDDDLKKAAVTYVDVKIKKEKELVSDRAGLSDVRADVESPIDYVKTQIKSMPLASDSINMDVQNFSQDINSEGANSHSDQISSFVAGQRSWLGKSASTELTTAVGQQVDRFATFDPKANLEALATFQNATNANQGSVQQSAAAARTGGQMIAMKQGDVKAALSALSEIDDGSNKILDINSMMTALENYLEKAANGTSGVPINYYLHDVTKDMLVDLWVAKYYPRKDDKAPTKTPGETPKE